MLFLPDSALAGEMASKMILYDSLPKIRLLVGTIVIVPLYWYVSMTPSGIQVAIHVDQIPIRLCQSNSVQISFQSDMC